MAKITGKEGLQFRGPARVFDGEQAMLDVVAQDPQQLKVCHSIRAQPYMHARTHAPMRKCTHTHFHLCIYVHAYCQARFVVAQWRFS